MLRKLALLLVATALFAPAASAMDTLRVMVYCDNIDTTAEPDCGTSIRQDSTANCRFDVGPCAYTPLDGPGVGVGFVLLFPDRLDPWEICEHPENCYGIVVTPSLLDGPCEVFVIFERPGVDTRYPIRCPTEGS